MKKQSYLIMVQNKQYEYILTKKGKETVLDCPAANIKQTFLNEDIPGVLLDLSELILAEQKWKKNQEEVMRFRVTKEEKIHITKRALNKGYKTLSAYLRDCALGGK